MPVHRALAALALLAPSAAALAATYQLAVDVPASLGGSDRLPNQILQSDAGAYSLVSTLGAGVAISALHLEASGGWTLSAAHAFNAGGTDYEARDLVSWNGASHALILDGGAAGIPADARIDALMRHPATNVPVLSFDVPVTISGTTYDPGDLVASGGSFAIYWDASAAGVPPEANLVGADVDASGVLVVAFDVPVTLGGTTYLPGQLVGVGAGGFSSYALDASWPAGTQLRDLAFIPAPGTVPDGSAVPGTPLTVVKSGTNLALSWGSSCKAADTDYEVYEGALGSWYSHASKVCSTAGATSVTFAAPAGLTYYLVVPRNALREGSYGRATSGAERPQGSAACLTREIGVCP